MANLQATAEVTPQLNQPKYFILSTSKISPAPIRHRGLLYLPVFSLLTISTMPNAETASATICSTSSGLIATPRPDNRPIKPRHVEGWLSFKSSISFSIFIPFIKKALIGRVNKSSLFLAGLFHRNKAECRFPCG